MTLKLECPDCKVSVAVMERKCSKVTIFKTGDQNGCLSRDYAKCPKCHREFTQAEIDALSQWA